MQQHPDRPRVFMTDDNAGLLAAIRDLLTDAEINVVGEASNTNQALRMIPPLTASAPLVVLMDVRVPGPVNGIEATRLLVDRCGADVRVIMFTAFPSEAIQRAARHAGAAAFLVKGTKAETIVATVRRVWSAVPVGA